MKLRNSRNRDQIFKFAKTFFGPWVNVFKSRIGPVARASIVGFLSTLLILIFGWSLFASSSDLNKRSAIAVLISPDSHRVGPTFGKSTVIGQCERFAATRPPDDLVPLNMTSIVCLGWTQRNSGQTVAPSLNPWVATKYSIESPRPSYSIGNSRYDAIGHVFGVFIWIAKVLLLPIAILLAVQFGVLVGSKYLQRITMIDSGSESNESEK